MYNPYFKGFSVNQPWYLGQMAMPNQGPAATPATATKLKKVSESSDSDSDSMDSPKKSKDHF